MHENDGRIPAIAFQHVPSSREAFSFADDGTCLGSAGDGNDKLDPLDRDAGIVDALLRAGNVHLLAVGHNHGNDYCCPISSAATTSVDREGGGSGSSDRRRRTELHVCFGRHSGYGGYGDFARGARMYELSLLDNDSSSHQLLAWRSWVRMESGHVVDEYDPSG